MSTHRHEANLTPAAGQLIQRVLRHLDGDPDAGAYVVLTRRVGEGTRIEAFGTNVTAEGIKGGAMLACEHLAADLRKCNCGKDHASEIVEVDHAHLLLSGKYAEQVRQ